MVLEKIPKFYMELLSVLSCAVVSDSVIPWTVAHQAPLSMVFSRQEYWSGLPFFSSRGSSQLRDQTLVSYIVKQILYHWATWEANGAPENSFMAREKLPGCHMAALTAPSMKYKLTNHVVRRRLMVLGLCIKYTIKKQVSPNHLSPSYSQSFHSRRQEHNSCPYSPHPGNSSAFSIPKESVGMG